MKEQERAKLQHEARVEVRIKEAAAERAHDRAQRIAKEKAMASAAHVSFAYKHPFAASKKGYGNLVKAEFQQDEQRMDETNEEIFGHSHKRHHTLADPLLTGSARALFPRPPLAWGLCNVQRRRLFPRVVWLEAHDMKPHNIKHKTHKTTHTTGTLYRQRHRDICEARARCLSRRAGALSSKAH